MIAERRATIVTNEGMDAAKKASQVMLAAFK